VRHIQKEQKMTVAGFNECVDLYADNVYWADYRTILDAIRKEKFKGNYDETTLVSLTTGNNYSGQKEALNLALDRLPEIQKASILLKDYEGYNYVEIVNGIKTQNYNRLHCKNVAAFILKKTFIKINIKKQVDDNGNTLAYGLTANGFVFAHK